MAALRCLATCLFVLPAACGQGVREKNVPAAYRGAELSVPAGSSLAGDTSRRAYDRSAAPSDETSGSRIGGIIPAVAR